MARENLRIGDCEIFVDYGDGNGEIFLGQTKGGIDFTFEREFEDLTVDKFGTAPLDMALTGQNLMIKLNLAEATNESLSRAIPEGKFAEFTTDSKIGIGRTSGYLLSDSEGLLRMHPRKNDPANRNEDVYIWKAVSMDNVEMPFKVDEQRLIPITYRALVDESRPDGEHLGRVGDEDIS